MIFLKLVKFGLAAAGFATPVGLLLWDKSELQNENAELVFEIDKLKEVLDKYKIDLNKELGNNIDYQTRIADLKKEMDGLNAVLLVNMNNLRELNKELRGNERYFINKESEIKKLKADINKGKEKIKELEGKVSFLRLVLKIEGYKWEAIVNGHFSRSRKEYLDYAKGNSNHIKAVLG